MVINRFEKLNGMRILNVFLVLFAITLSLTSCKVKKRNATELLVPEAGIINHATVPDITECDIRLHISVLASDSLHGRKAGTPYEAMAAEYIKEKFESLGLKAFNGNYYQKVPISTRKYFSNCELNFDGYKGDYPEDFRPVIMFDSLTVAGEVFFAGNGDDSNFENIDVKGKWAMVLENDNSILYDIKATIKSKGALGLLVIGIDGTTGKERIVLPVDSVPMIKVSYPLADRLFAHAGTSITEVLSKAKQGENQNMAIPVILTATVKSVSDSLTSQNVVACLKTKDTQNGNKYIVIGAHYDHLGTKTDDDSVLIYNGADDNASGVAGMLEIAEKLCAEKKLKYNVIFAAFGAEELGLIGSQYFCNNPPVPLEDIKLMVNMDMIGRMDSSNHAYINTIKPNVSLDAVVDKVKKSHRNINVVVSSDNHYQSTDHFSFYNKHIPVISFITGLHKDYHTPNDTIGAINFRGEKRLLDFVYDLVSSPAMDDCIRSFTSSDVNP